MSAAASSSGAARRSLAGRATELAQLRARLAGDGGLIYLHGEAGVGKSALARELVHGAIAEGRTAVILDAEGLGPAELPARIGEALSGVTLVVLDAAERLEELAARLLHEALPQGPRLTVLVVSRRAPTLSWRRARGGWQVETLCLGRLSDEAIRTVVRGRIAASHLERAVEFAAGHPLLAEAYVDALRSGADAARATQLAALAAAELFEDIWRPERWRTLAVVAAQPATTYTRLLDVLGAEAADAEFAWLCTRPWVTSTPEGLVPHSVFRTAFLALLRVHAPSLLAPDLAEVESAAAPVAGELAVAPATGAAERLRELGETARLSERERQVLDLIVLGRSHAEIGSVLGISGRTARFHQSNVLRKLGAESRLDLLRLLL